MKNRSFSSVARRTAMLVGGVVAALLVTQPARAGGEPITPEQLKLFDDLFMETVRVGDLLFHGDAALEKKMGISLSATGMACAMCHPFSADTHPQSFPKFQISMAKIATLRDMTNWCIEKPMQGTVIDVNSDAMKALEAYMTWSNTNSKLVPGTY